MLLSSFWNYPPILADVKLVSQDAILVPELDDLRLTFLKLPDMLTTGHSAKQLE